MTAFGLASLLTDISAPIFSIIGWIVRSRQASSPDISYNDPEILLWAYVRIFSSLTDIS